MQVSVRQAELGILWKKKNKTPKDSYMSRDEKF